MITPTRCERALQQPLFPLDDVYAGKETNAFLQSMFDLSRKPTNKKPSRCHNVQNSWMLEGLALVGIWGIPSLKPTDKIPRKLMAFSEAIQHKTAPPHTYVHFYEDDVRFKRIWNNPKKYMPKLAMFSGVIEPDFSLYANMAPAEKIYNTYRNRLLAAYMQKEGYTVIPNVRISGKESIPYTLAGIPENSVVSLGLHGCTKDVHNRITVVEEIKIICDSLNPKAIVIYGSEAYNITSYPYEKGIPVYTFKPDTYNRSRARKHNTQS